ncbi:MAG TPA: hypothetical protein PLI90_13035, partial [Rhodocyclaceae bacterium]|nr:hypothetical protein [Rhodocyclaceae bacterium]
MTNSTSSLWRRHVLPFTFLLVLLAAATLAGDSVRAGLGANPDARVLLAVGPEGGWNAFELRLLEARGFQHIG